MPPGRQLINQITPIGAAFPDGDFPNPVKAPRSVIIALRRAEANSANMIEIDQLIAALTTSTEAVAWLEKNWAEYERGIEGAGFEVKRYRCAMYFPKTPIWEGQAQLLDTANSVADDTKAVLVMREDEDPSALIEFVKDMIRTYNARGWTTKNEVDKSTGIYRDAMDPSGSRLKLYCKLKITVIRPKDYAPAMEARYTNPLDVANQKAEAQLAIHQNMANPTL